MYPGNEKSEFQTRLSQINNYGIIGLTYVIESYIGNNFESVFYCVLCDEQYDLQMIIPHLITPVHRMNYLVRKPIFEKKNIYIY